VRRDDVKRRLDEARSGADARARSGAEAARASATQNLAGARAELDRLRAQKLAEEQAYAAAVRADTGLLARLAALRSLTADQPELRLAYLVLMLFITTIEVLPVLVTFLTNTSGPTLYQRVLAKVESNELAVAETDLDLELRAHTVGDRPTRRNVRRRLASRPRRRSAPRGLRADAGGGATAPRR
jgi:hypothetical protein